MFRSLRGVGTYNSKMPTFIYARLLRICKQKEMWKFFL